MPVLALNPRRLKAPWLATLASLGAQAQTAGDSQELAQLRAQLATLQTKVNQLEARQQSQAKAPA